MRKPKILVTSAAGNTGMPTTLQLLGKGYPVRAWVRSNDHRAKQLKEAGADIFVGDQYSITDMRAAMTGVQRAYHCAPTAPNALHFGTVFAIAAQEKKLEHVVMLSQWLSDPNHPSVFTRETWLNERVLNMLPDSSLTVINTGWFAENYFFVLETAAQLGIMPLPLGDGDVKNNAPPSNSDIAAVNVATLVNPEAHAGKVYRPTGPKLLSPNEIATAMGLALKRKVKYQEIPESMLLKALKVQGFDEAMPTQLRIYAEEYRRGAFAVHAPTNVVRQLTGREPEDFETIARHTIAKRADAVQTTRNKLRAIANFMKILATAKIDPDVIERRRDHVLLKSPGFVRDSETWLKTHDPDAGYSPDRFDASHPLSVIRETRA